MNKEIKIAGKKIFYRVYGNGKTVMLVDEPPQTPPKEGLANTLSQLLEDADRAENFQFSESSFSGLSIASRSY